LLVRSLDQLYRLTSPLTLRSDAQAAHHRFLAILRWADDAPLMCAITGTLGAWTLPHDPVVVGGVRLPHPLILSAGMVKGDGFASERQALETVDSGVNIVPGWRVLPKLVGPVEFGSFTRHPRKGNPGTVLWRRTDTRSTQNRIGLKNPGAEAAAAFLSARRDALPDVYGINIAVSPGVDDPDQERDEVLASWDCFHQRGVRPSWLTLNLSCPNTEDDPSGNQTETKARDLCGALVEAACDVPVWVKVGPCLSQDQYAALMEAFAAVGVRAVVATNTLPQPTPDGTQIAGVGGGDLHTSAVEAVQSLATAQRSLSSPVDIIGCGGVMDADSYIAMCAGGAEAVMYYSAMVFRSPLAASFIYNEARRHANKGHAQ
jgi:dihydroorotate dehydrogenase